MDSRTQQKLEEAKNLALTQHLVESYNIFRRFYDRLPFQIDQEHADYIGVFTRVMSELGKNEDLAFYISELEKRNETQSSPGIRYQLAFMYTYLPTPRVTAACKILENLIRDSEAAEFHSKAKMLLAHLYDVLDKDVGLIRKLIFSIEPSDDPFNQVLVDIWKAKVLRNEGDFVAAETAVLDLISRIESEKNWYAYFSAKLILGGIYLRTGETRKVKAIIREIRTVFAGRRFKHVANQIEELERNVNTKLKTTSLSLRCGLTQTTLSSDGKTVTLDKKGTADRFLLLLARRGFANNEVITRKLFSRSYQSDRDDKLLQQEFYSVKSRVAELGLPEEVIVQEEAGYRLLSKVEIFDGEV